MARVYGGAARRPATPRPAYARAVDFAKALAAVVALVVGLPLLIIGLALAGPVGWVAAAVVLPLATLATILWLGRARPGDGEPPGPQPK
jgi:hypothetical protein